MRIAITIAAVVLSVTGAWASPDAERYTAMLVGTDSKSYFTKVGQRLFDGVITAIDASTVTFRQEVTDPLSSVRSRDVKKTLYPSEEGRQ